MSELLTFVTRAALGLYAGALATEAAVLVPYWRRMQPTEFFRLHPTLGPGLFRYFAPVTAVACILAVIYSTAAWWSERATLLDLMPGATGLFAVGLYFAYFHRANASFAAQSLADADLAGELRRWAFWHTVRTALVFAAFLVACR